jgi:DNA polymerase III subunit chi
LAEVRFHHCERRRVEEALPVLLETAYEAGKRVLVRVASDDELAALNDRLWTYDDASFLAHGGPGDGDPMSQPIFLTTRAENANGAALLALMSGAETDPVDAAFAEVVLIFDGRDPDAVAEARLRWKAMKDQGHAVSYWREGEDGQWERGR